MSRRLMLGIAAITFGLAVWTACTGDDPVTTQTGAVGQPCNAGNTCNVPELECVGGICQTASASSTSGAATSSSGSSSSSSGGASSSSGGTSSSSGNSTPECRDLTNLSNTEPLVCPKGAGQFQSCKDGEICCPGKGCITDANCGGFGGDDWQCFSLANCPVGQHCYIKQSDYLTDAGTVCGEPLSIGFQESQYVSVGRCTEPDNAPSSPWLQLCRTNGDCDNTAQCVPMALVVGGAKMLVKGCKEAPL